jgi:hypothetical protein
MRGQRIESWSALQEHLYEGSWRGEAEPGTRA